MPYTANQLNSLPLGYDIYNKMIPGLGGPAGSADVTRPATWMDPGSLYQGESQQQAMPGAAPSPEAMAALQGYTFEWQPSGQGAAGTLVAFKDGQQVGAFRQTDTSTAQALAEWGMLAGAGFGGLGLAGLGPLAGALGGAGGAAGSIGLPGTSELAAYGASLTPAEVAATATGLDLGGMTAAGAAGGAAGALGSGGWGGGSIGLPGTGELSAYGASLTPAQAASGVAGSGLGSIGSTLGTAAAGSPFSWGELGKAAIGPALSTGVQMYSANQATNAMQDATNKANDLQRYIYDTNRSDNMPALQARNSALEQMQSLLKDPSTITSQPGYQFGMAEGNKALNNGAAARGMTYSGAQGKALQRFGQDYAGSKLNDSFNRLSTLANGGQLGAGTIANSASNYGNNVGNNLTAQGGANAMQYMVGGNALGTAINGLTAYGQKQGWWKG